MVSIIILKLTVRSRDTLKTSIGLRDPIELSFRLPCALLATAFSFFRKRANAEHENIYGFFGLDFG